MNTRRLTNLVLAVATTAALAATAGCAPPPPFVGRWRRTSDTTATGGDVTVTDLTFNAAGTWTRTRTTTRPMNALFNAGCAATENDAGGYTVVTTSGSTGTLQRTWTSHSSSQTGCADASLNLPLVSSSSAELSALGSLSAMAPDPWSVGGTTLTFAGDAYAGN